MSDDLAAVRAVEERFYGAMRRLHRDPGALAELLATWSEGDEVSTMNARGGVERGGAAVRDRWTWWASRGVPMEAERIEHLTFVAGGDAAYSVALEHHATRSLRVTHAYRREEGEWKLVHRHADPLVGRQG